jgi:primase-polymerase (primpol)-like protein
MLADDDLGAVDLDHCSRSQDGAIDAWAQKEIDAASSAYVEVTVSSPGGCASWASSPAASSAASGRFEDTTNGAAIESLWRTNRYVTISGPQISGGAELTDIERCSGDIARRFDTEAADAKPATSSSSSSEAAQRRH